MEISEEVIDESYQEFIDSMSQHCHCCPICQSVPCDGVLAGGFCDDICNCDEEE